MVGGTSTQSNPEVDDLDQLPSEFELWAQGKLPSLQLTSGQESLTNYRELFSIQMTGEDKTGNSLNGSHEYVIEKDGAADRSHELETRRVPNRYLSGVYEWVVADGFTYLVRETNQGGRVCEKSENRVDASHISDVHVTRMLQTIAPGELLEEDVRVQGIPADVYEIEGLSLLFVRELHAINGKVWIAQQPTYFLKAEGAIEGVLEFDSTLYSGEATFSYEITDFDQVQVQLPALCAHPPEEMIPLPANAQEVVEFPDLITYSSPDSVDTIMSFYLEELVSQGWQVDDPQIDAFEQAVAARTTSDQGVQLSIEVEITGMAPGSYVQIAWKAQ